MASHVDSILESLEGRAKAEQSKAAPSRGITIDVYVIGNCPRCGSPIYGPDSIPAGIHPNVTRTCSCFLERSFDDTIRYT